MWWEQDNPRLTGTARAAIESQTTAIFVSVASAWELEIKAGLGRLNLHDGIEAMLEANAFSLLPVTLEHCRIAGALPQYHRDPFDRMLIAQAVAEDLTLISSDRQFARYDVDVLWD